MTGNRIQDLGSNLTDAFQIITFGRHLFVFVKSIIMLKNIGFVICCCIILSFQEVGATNIVTSRGEYPDLLCLKNVPDGVRDWKTSVFSDLGAWHGYALPDYNRGDSYGGFVGPRLMTGGTWVSNNLSQAHLVVDGEPFDFIRNCYSLTYLPGKLVQVYRNQKLEVTQELVFASSRSAMIQTHIQNNSSQNIKVELTWKGSMADSTVNITSCSNGIRADLPDSKMYVVVSKRDPGIISLEKNRYSMAPSSEIEIKPGGNLTDCLCHSVLFKEEDFGTENKQVQDFLHHPQRVFQSNKNRWNGYLSKVISRMEKPFNKKQYRRVAVKAIMTLITNWRSPAQDLLHDGLFPSYMGFNSFWAWDSWKHAAAVALFDPLLASNQIRAMFDYQNEAGMIPDVVRRNKKYNNWRDTKPPLAAWAVLCAFRESGDVSFVRELYPKLKRYHHWWYANRDHDNNGLCEYGSTDGTLIAAAWESGMDNAVRYDKTRMVKNDTPDAWSMNQEGVDLNSFLYAEKLYLAELAESIGEKRDAQEFHTEAKVLKSRINEQMFDASQGFYFDRRMEDGKLIKVMGPEGWLPLWASVASSQQGNQVKQVMTDPKHFNSAIPLGTLSIDHAALRPYNGYWRGPVWIDQVYFGVAGLCNYGYKSTAAGFVTQYLNHAQGLMKDAPFHENYNPLTGEHLNCPHFSWSAASTLKMLLLDYQK